VGCGSGRRGMGVGGLGALAGTVLEGSIRLCSGSAEGLLGPLWGRCCSLTFKFLDV
jgi:hypothetical protein